MLAAQGLDVTVGGKTLCRRLNLEFSSGQCWAILGANGSGKTSLLHTLIGLLPPDDGEILLDGTALHLLPRRRIAQRLGLLLQENHDPFPSTVLETALSGRHPHTGRWQNESKEDIAITERALATMDLAGMAQRAVQTLSGGERRRLAIATLLSQSPQLLLLDEPLNHLDLHHQLRLMQHLRQLSAEGLGVAMVLHDPNTALRYCDHTLLLYGDGAWECGQSRQLLTTERLSRLYRHPMRRLQCEDEILFLPQIGP